SLCPDLYRTTASFYITIVILMLTASPAPCGCDHDRDITIEILSQAAIAACVPITKGTPIMPITVIATDGIFSAAAENTMFAELTASFLRHHDLAGNAFLTPNVIGEISTIPKGRSFAGGTSSDIVVIELKVPSFGLGSTEQKSG